MLFGITLSKTKEATLMAASSLNQQITQLGGHHIKSGGGVKESVMCKRKCKCGEKLFHVEDRKDCYGCEYNPWWDDDKEEWVSEEPETCSDTMVGIDLECKLGSSQNEGCLLVICISCQNVDHFPLGVF